MTGDAAVDEVLQKVAGLVGQPLEDHPQVLKEAQNALQQFLSSPNNAS